MIKKQNKMTKKKTFLIAGLYLLALGLSLFGSYAVTDAMNMPPALEKEAEIKSIFGILMLMLSGVTVTIGSKKYLDNSSNLPICPHAKIMKAGAEEIEKALKQVIDNKDAMAFISMTSDVSFDKYNKPAYSNPRVCPLYKDGKCMGDIENYSFFAWCAKTADILGNTRS